MQEHKIIDYDFAYDEAEETLSLSNLVTHDAAAWNDYSSRDMSPSSNLSSPDCFEFFTDEWSAKITTLPQCHHQNIIFCGKLIQSKNPAAFTKRKEFNYSGLSNNDLSVHGKMFALTSSTKSRWYMLFLGTAPRIKTSGGAQLREIKRRLCHRQGEGGQRVDEYKKKSKGGGLWGVVKALGCGEINHATAVNTDSIKSISRVSKV